MPCKPEWQEEPANRNMGGEWRRVGGGAVFQVEDYLQRTREKKRCGEGSSRHKDGRGKLCVRAHTLPVWAPGSNSWHQENKQKNTAPKEARRKGFIKDKSWMEVRRKRRQGLHFIFHIKIRGFYSSCQEAIVPPPPTLYTRVSSPNPRKEKMTSANMWT